MPDSLFTLLLLTSVLASFVVSWRLSQKARGRRLVMEQARFLGHLGGFMFISGLLKLEVEVVPAPVLEFLYTGFGALVVTMFVSTIRTWSVRNEQPLSAWSAGLLPFLAIVFGFLSSALHAVVDFAVAGLPWYAVVVVVACIPTTAWFGHVVSRRWAELRADPMGPEALWLGWSVFMLTKGLVWIVGGRSAVVDVILVMEVPVILIWAALTLRAVPFTLTIDTIGTASVQSMGEALFLLEPGGRVDYANPAGSRLFGASPVGRGFQSFCTGWPCSGAATVTRVNGETVPVMVRSAPVVLDGEAVGYAVSVTDVSQMQAALDEARSAREQADRASRAKQEFVAVMSHEIRTPMNAIVGLAHLLDETELSPRQAAWTRTIRESSDALLTMLTDILDFSRVESGRMAFESIVFDPARMLEGAASMVQTTAQQKGLDFQVALVDLPPAVKGDPTRLRQIVLNLLSNAVKFTTAGSVRLDARMVGGCLRVAVKDTGPGIAEAALPGLFDAFTQADASTTRRFGGTGLGLAISRQLAEGMSGSLTVDSVPGEGAEFVVSVPMPACAAVEAREDRPEVAAGELSGLRVLVVEDNPVNRAVMRAVLQHFGVDSDEAVDGEEGVRKALSSDYDLVFVDLHMPGMDGWEALTQIRASSGAGGPLLVSHSANVQTEEVERARRCGATSHLPKPATPSAVFDVLQAALGDHSHAAPAAR